MGDPVADAIRRLGPQFVSDSDLSALDPYDTLKLESQLATKGGYSPEQAAQNRAQTAYDLAYSSPLAIPLGLRDIATANEARDEALASGATPEEADRIRNQQAFGGLLGMAIPGRLPFGQMARSATQDAASSARIFAGPVAKTADRAALAQAEKMEAQGARPDDIWRATGWGRGADGQWRFEIDDSRMGVKIPRNATSDSFSTYSAAVDHPELFEAYPPMQRNRINFDHRTPNSSLKTQTSPNAFDAKKFDTSIGVEGRKVVGAPTFIPRHYDSVRGSTAHEMQHNVQLREGFAQGADPVGLEMEHFAQQQPRIDELNQKIITLASAHPDTARQFMTLANTQIDDVAGAGLARSALEKLPNGKEILASLDELEGLTKTDVDFYDVYRRHAGEVEARNAADRLRMTPEERRVTPPWATEDVPRAQQIIRFK